MGSSTRSVRYVFCRGLRVFLASIFRFFARLISSSKRGYIPSIQEPLLLMPATVLAEKIRQKEITSFNVVKAYIDRIREVNPLINAIVEERFANALDEARQVDTLVRETTKTMQELKLEKPLLGVPVTIKSNLAVKGMLHEAGLMARKGVRAEQDAFVTKKIRDAGAIVVAITNCPELSASYNTFNKIHGQTLNPHDLALSSGGSSGGESALISAGCSILGIGNDLCGSLRQPAAVTGIFGHRPSRDLISNVGIFPAIEQGKVIDRVLVQGPLCRYASDLSTAMRVLTSDSADKISFDLAVDFKKLNIYYCDDDSLDPLTDPVSPEIRLSMRKVLVHFHKKYGVIPKRVSFPDMQQTPWILSAKSKDDNLRTFSSHLANDPEREISVWKELIKCAFGCSKHTFEGLWFAFISKATPDKKSPQREIYRRAEETMTKECERILTENSILLFPSCPATKIYPMECIMKFFMMQYYLMFSLFGYPVTQCPVGKDADGYPLSLQVVGGRFQDHLTIAMAEELEREFGGWQKPCLVEKEQIKSESTLSHIKSTK